MKKSAVVLAVVSALILLATAALARSDNPLRPAPPGLRLPAPEAPEPVKPDQIREAAYWTSQDGKIKLFLVRNGSEYSLFVSGGQGLKVTYHTTINSSQPVLLPLEPLKGSGCLSEYRFKHTFSRTTIWMALEFAKDGKPLPELKRSFMNGIRPGLR